MKNIPFSPPDISESEIEEVVAVLRSGWITTGSKTKELEHRIADYIGTKKAVCLNSATAAMELTLRVLGIGQGDEVITSAYTYSASAAVIHHVGAKIILIDTAPDSFEMDYDKVAEAITDKTKAIIPVDIAGVICNYERIYEVLESKKDLYNPSNDIQKCFDRIIIISDCAHGFGAVRKGSSAGAIADFTCYSFHAVKNLTTAEGGAVVWLDRKGIDNDFIYKQYQLLSLHGQDKDALSKTKIGSWEYDIIAPYYKCNMTDILAAIGLAQFKRYPDMIKRRQEIIRKYNEELKNLDIKVLNHRGSDHVSSGHLYLIRVNDISIEQRNTIIKKMAEKGVSCNVHYKPLPMLTAYKNLGFNIKDYPNAYDLYHNEITLPLHTSLDDEDIIYICECLRKVIRDVFSA